MEKQTVTYFLNIGASRSHVNLPEVTEGEIWNAFRLADLCPDYLFGPIFIGHEQGGENTFILQMDVRPTPEQMGILCGALDQQAIALACVPLSPSDDYRAAIALWGELHGPKAAEWGPFNADYFRLPGGLLLQSAQASA